MNPEPRLAIIVSTIGRPEQFRRLLYSVHESSDASVVEFVVIDQSDDGRCAAVLDEQKWAMATRAGTSGRGASVGRNAGLKLSTAPLVSFPDDDAWYSPETIGRILATFKQTPDLAGICGRQITLDGRSSMLRWQAEPGLVTRRNFLRTSIMSTMVFRRPWLDKIGQFDENMGVGSPSWYGACEESDLLLRVIEAGGEVQYMPSLLVFQDDPRDEVDDAFVAKMLKYGCGQGHLWRKRKLPLTQLAYLCARKVPAAAIRFIRGERTLARADLAWLWGNISGVVDRPPRSLRLTPAGSTNSSG